jgi:hypothetical protein
MVAVFLKTAYKPTLLLHFPITNLLPPSQPLHKKWNGWIDTHPWLVYM